jgi:hypothetical protein
MAAGKKLVKRALPRSECRGERRASIERNVFAEQKLLRFLTLSQKFKMKPIEDHRITSVSKQTGRRHVVLRIWLAIRLQMPNQLRTEVLLFHCCIMKL